MASTTYDSAMTEVSVSAGAVRERILDAATQCLLESGLDARLHAAIAERAGLSRPTVYKYVGDQSAILQAVLDREIDAFFTAVVPLLTQSEDLENDLVDAVVFVVGYARRHELLQKGLREHPELVLPALTTESGPLLDRVHGLFDDQLERSLTAAGSEADPRTVVEWIYRIIVSLVIAGPAAESADDLRRYIGGLLDLTEVVARSSFRARR